MTKEYQNYKFQQPYQQAMYYCSLIIRDQTWPWMDVLEVLPCLEAEDLAKFVSMMLSRAFLECYVAGSYASIILSHCLDSVIPFSFPFIISILSFVLRKR